MSIQAPTWMVEQYKSTVYHLSQQKGSRLRRAVRTETVVGKNAFYDQLGTTEMRERTSRHADTPRMDVPHARRRVSLTDHDWAELIDNEDQIRMLADPTSPYAEAAAMAAGRAIDRKIIAAADGTAYTGVDGSTSTAFDTAMIVDVQTVWPGVSAADTGLNVAKLIAAAELLASNNVDPDDEMFLVPNRKQISSLLKDERMISADYNRLFPLMEGQIMKYMGFTIIPTQLIGTDSNADHKVLFWAKGGMLLGIGKDITTRIGERADKSYATQVFCALTIGATRMEEARVGYIECDPGGSPTTDA